VILTFAVLCWPRVTCAQTITTVSDFNPNNDVLINATETNPIPVSSREQDKEHPSVHVIQHIPKNDTMTAMITVKDVIYKNPNGTVPTFSGTSKLDNGALSFFVPGIIREPGGTKVFPTDIFQSHTDPSLGSGIIQLAAYQHDPGMLPLGSFLQANVGDRELNVPDFITATASNLYFGVDLTTWASEAPGSFTLGDTFTIVDGTSSLLPGYLFSTTPLTATDSGWTTSTPYDGTATLDSFHGLSVVPEPTSLTLAVIAISVLVGALRLIRH